MAQGAGLGVAYYRGVGEAAGGGRAGGVEGWVWRREGVAGVGGLMGWGREGEGDQWGPVRALSGVGAGG